MQSYVLVCHVPKALRCILLVRKLLCRNMHLECWAYCVH